MADIKIPLWQRMMARLGHDPASGRLGDFTTSKRVIPISLIAVGIGIISAYVALILLRLIGFFTNLFFFQRFGTAMVSSAGNHLGGWVIVVPVIGGLIVGVMARYGSDRIRGHGIPEAIEAILLKGSRIQPRVAALKPVSAAIAIGSGGPFGAEGPIIMTGGAVGSLIAQFFHLTDAERKTLLVAGAAAGMSATFASPIAAVILAVELLLFEWKPRSFVPVALASATAAAARRYILGPGPLFPMHPHGAWFSGYTLAGCLLMGLLGGMLAWALTYSIYAVEDAFEHVPIHWMWWPAMGGLAVGVGGYIFPQALGVGYDVIGQLLQGDMMWRLVLGILLVKSTMWAISLGSGTSGGILAPLLMMGGALGAAGAHFLPAEGPGFWQAVTMAAGLAGTMRSPLTSVVFAIELTHEMNLMLPLLIACAVAHGFTALLMPRSILTEKLSRRGYHLSREYAVDPLEVLFVREVMRTNVVGLSSTTTLREISQSMNVDHGRSGQWLYPILDEQRRMLGVVTRKELQQMAQSHPGRDDDADINVQLSDFLKRKPVVAYPDEPLRIVVNRMAETGLTRFPVLERRQEGKKRSAADRGKGGDIGASIGSDIVANPGQVVGLVSLTDLLKARVINLESERQRERVLPIRIFLPSRFRRNADAVRRRDNS
jgi:H+/Cl- antiporter ClcA/predicted transcriptional regulator